MSHIAALTYNGKYLIVMPMAVNLNLEIFLHVGRPPNYIYSCQFEHKYNFQEVFPWLKTQQDVQRATIGEIAQIAGALTWLHNGLDIAEEDKLFLAHMDLKPENILIYGDPRDIHTPAGKWMLTDFGISASYRDPSPPFSDRESERPPGSSTNEQMPFYPSQRGHGPYQSPEASLDDDQIDPRGCDLWSYGGILLDILAFATEKDVGVRKLRAARAAERSDRFFTNSSPSNRRKLKGTGELFQLKPTIVYWKNDILDHSDIRWVEACLKLAFDQCIVIDPRSRGSMSRIREELGSIHQQLLNPGRRSSVPSPRSAHGGSYPLVPNRSATENSNSRGNKTFSMFKLRAMQRKLQMTTPEYSSSQTSDGSQEESQCKCVSWILTSSSWKLFCQGVLAGS